MTAPRNHTRRRAEPSRAEYPGTPVAHDLRQVVEDTDLWLTARFGWSDQPAGGPEPAGALMAERLLAEGACVGDQDCLDQLCQREWLAVHRLVAAVVEDPVTVEVLTQEVFARAVSDLSAFCHGDVRFKEHLAQVAAGLLAGRPGRAAVQPATLVILPASERGRLVRLVDRLAPPSRHVLSRRLFHGYSLEEMAAELGRPADALRVEVGEALDALRAELYQGVAR